MKQPFGVGITSGILSIATFVGLTALAAPASAQTAPPAAPPPPAGVAPPGSLAGYAPPRLEWSKGDPIPAGYTPATEFRSGFVIAGGVTLGVTWVFGSLIPGIAILAGCKGSSTAGLCGAFGGTLLIPAIGPFVSMAPLTAGGGASGGSGSAVGYAILAIDGLVQSAGAAMLLYGILAPRDVLVRNDKLGRTSIQWKPTPMRVGEHGQGVGIVGSF